MPGMKPCQTKPSTSGSVDPGLGAVRVEQAQLDPLGDLAEHGEVGAGSVVGRAERVGLARPDVGQRGGRVGRWGGLARAGSDQSALSYFPGLTKATIRVPVMREHHERSSSRPAPERSPWCRAAPTSPVTARCWSTSTPVWPPSPLTGRTGATPSVTGCGTNWLRPIPGATGTKTCARSCSPGRLRRSLRVPTWLRVRTPSPPRGRGSAPRDRRARRGRCASP